MEVPACDSLPLLAYLRVPTTSWGSDSSRTPAHRQAEAVPSPALPLMDGGRGVPTRTAILTGSLMEGDTLRQPGDVEGAGVSVSGGSGHGTGELSLLDLPDDVLRLVVGCIMGCVGGLRRGDHVPLLLTCRRLAAIGYRSVKEVHVSSRTLPFVEANRQGDLMPDGHVSAVALLTSPAGERLQTRLFSLRDFFRHRVPHVRRVVLSDELADGAVTPHGLLSQQIFWGLLRGVLAPLPVSSLVCDHSAVAALVNQQVSSVSLRCLWLGGLDAREEALRNPDQYRGVLYVLGRHRRTLQELRVAAFVHGPAHPDGFAWSMGYLLSVLRPVVYLPALRTLRLNCYVCRKTAGAMAAACPLVETLVLEAGCGCLGGDTGRCWPFPGTFPHLNSLTCMVGSPSGAANPSLDLLHTLRGRRLQQLTLDRLTESSPLHGPSSSDSVIGLQHVAALKSCAALPATLNLGRLGYWTQELLLCLCDESNEVASLRELTMCVSELQAAPLDPLSRLSGLIRLTLEVQKRATEEVVPPGRARPRQHLGRSPSGLGGACVDYGSSMVRALWHTGSRLSLHTRSQPKSVPTTLTTEEAAERLASRLPSLQHLIISDKAWSFVRGRIVGRSP